MAAEGTGGGKYILSFSLEGTGEKQLNAIVNSLKRIAKAAGSGETASAVGEASRAVNDLGSESLKAAVQVSRMNDELENAKMGFMEMARWSDLLVGFGQGVAGTMRDLGESVMSAVAPSERLALQLKVLGKLPANEIREVQSNIDQLVAATPFLTEELQGVTQALVHGGASLKNWRDEAGKTTTLSDQVAQGFTRLDSAANEAFGSVSQGALSVVADFAAVTNNVGARMPTFVFGLQRALATKTARLLTDQLNPEAMRALVGAAGLQVQGTADDVIQRMYEYLKKNNAVGMAALASSTADGIKSNFEEIPLLIFRAIGGDPNDPNSVYGRLKAVYMALFLDISKVINNPQWKAGIGEALTSILSVAEVLAGWMGKIASSVLKFAAEHPLLTRIATVMTVIAAGAALLLGALVGIAAQLGLAAIGVVALTVTLTRLWSALAGVRTMILLGSGPLAILALKVAIVAGALYTMYKAFQYLINSSPALTKFVKEISMFFSALGEALSNWSGETTTIAEETATNLENAGMITPFLRLIQGIRYAQVVFERFWGEAKHGLVELALAFSNGSDESLRLARNALVTEDTLESMTSVGKLGFNGLMEAMYTVLKVTGFLYMVFKALDFLITGAVTTVMMLGEALFRVAEIILGPEFDLLFSVIKLLTGDVKGAITQMSEGYTVSGVAGLAGEGNMFGRVWDQMGGKADEYSSALDWVSGLEGSRFTKDKPVGMVGPRASMPSSGVLDRGTASGPMSGETPYGAYSPDDPWREDIARALANVSNRPININATLPVILDGREIGKASFKHAVREQEAGFTPYEGSFE